MALFSCACLYSVLFLGGRSIPELMGGEAYIFSNYLNVVRHLRNAWMFCGKKGGKMVLSRRFSFYLDKASDC